MSPETSNHAIPAVCTLQTDAFILFTPPQAVPKPLSRRATKRIHTPHHLRTITVDNRTHTKRVHSGSRVVYGRQLNVRALFQVSASLPFSSTLTPSRSVVLRTMLPGRAAHVLVLTVLAGGGVRPCAALVDSRRAPSTCCMVAMPRELIRPRSTCFLATGTRCGPSRCPHMRRTSSEASAMSRWQEGDSDRIVQRMPKPAKVFVLSLVPLFPSHHQH